MGGLNDSDSVEERLKLREDDIVGETVSVDGPVLVWVPVLVLLAEILSDSVPVVDLLRVSVMLGSKVSDKLGLGLGVGVKDARESEVVDDSDIEFDNVLVQVSEHDLVPSTDKLQDLVAVPGVLVWEVFVKLGVRWVKVGVQVQVKLCVRDWERPPVQDRVWLGVRVLPWLLVTVSDPGETVGPRLPLADALTDSVATTDGVQEQVPDSVCFRLPEEEYVPVVVGVGVPDRVVEADRLPDEELVAEAVVERDTEARDAEKVEVTRLEHVKLAVLVGVIVGVRDFGEADNTHDDVAVHVEVCVGVGWQDCVGL